MRILRLVGARPHAGRALIGVLAGSLLSVGQGPGVSVVAVSAPSVVVIYQAQWSETSFPAVHLIGQVRNDTGQAVTGIRVALNLLDINGATIGRETAFPDLEVLGLGEVSPFEVILAPPPAGYATFSVAGVSFGRATSTPNHTSLPVTVMACQPPFPASNICGKVTNTGTVSLEGIHAALTLVNGVGTIVAQHYVIVDANNLAPGVAGSFAIDPTGDPVYAAVLGTGEATYPVDLNPPSLDFGSQLVKAPSAAQTVTVRNKGLRALAIGTVSAPSDFVPTSLCPSSLPSGQSCLISVVFNPGSMGAKSGYLVIASDGGGSPDSIPLTGTGVAPIVQLIAGGGTDYGNVDVGKSSPPKAITLTNVGTYPLTVTGIMTTGDFSRPQPNTCLGALAINASCVIYVVFTPGIPGTRNGSLTLTDNALDTPQQLVLTGFGVGSAVVFTPTTLNFGDANVVVTDLTVTLINAGTGNLTITGVSTDGPFVASPCSQLPVTMAPGARCVIVVTFLTNTVGASGPGLLVGLLTVNDSAGNHYVLLTANPASARGPIQAPGNPRPGPPPPPPPMS